MSKSGNTSTDTPSKRRDFTFVLQDPTQWEHAIEYVESCPAYAYIKHDKDPNTSPHYHFFIEFPNARSFRSVARDLNIPVHMLERPRNPEGLLFYLTHQDKKSREKGKTAYQRTDIITNLPASKFQTPLDKSEFWDLCVDLAEKLYDGEITYRQYMRQLKLSLVDTMTPLSIVNFSLKVKFSGGSNSVEFEHVSNIQTPFGPAIGTPDLTSVPSSTCQKSKQQRLIPNYPT